MSAPTLASHGNASGLLTLYFAEPSELLVLSHLKSGAVLLPGRAHGFGLEGAKSALSTLASVASSIGAGSATFSSVPSGRSCGGADASASAAAALMSRPCATP